VLSFVPLVVVQDRVDAYCSRDPTRTLPPKHLGPSKIIRQWVGLSAVGESVECETFYPSNGDWAGSVELEVGLCSVTETWISIDLSDIC
jgi:vesicle-fusing ATPase